MRNCNRGLIGCCFCLGLWPNYFTNLHNVNWNRLLCNWCRKNNFKAEKAQYHAQQVRMLPHCLSDCTKNWKVGHVWLIGFGGRPTMLRNTQAMLRVAQSSSRLFATQAAPTRKPFAKVAGYFFLFIYLRL
jgi:hypothetical protein